MNASGLVGFSSIFVKNIVRLQILTLILSASSIKSITITTVDVPLCWLFLVKKDRKKKSGTVATIKPHTPKEYKAESFHKTKNVFTIIAMK